MQRQHLDLPGVIAVVYRHADQLLRDWLVAGVRHTRELRRRRRTHRVDELLNILASHRPELGAGRGLSEEVAV